jgi:hypothetical protein
MRRLVIAAALTVAACSDSSVAPDTNAHVGDYVLRSIDGNPPPQIVSSDDEEVVSIVGGVVVLAGNSTYLDSTDVQIVAGGGIASRQDVARGAYRLSNDTVFFRFGESEYFMIRNGSELVQDFDGIELVYRR